MKKIKTRLFLIAVIVIIGTLLSQGSLAYYVNIGKAVNVVTSGSIKMQIIEKGQGDAQYPVGGVYIMPGDVVTKKVSVKSLSDHPFYLRVKVVYGVNSAELSAEDCFKLNVNQEDWVYSDGWYYYKKAVSAGEETSNVFSQVEIVGNKVDNSYIGKTLTLTVKADAVQSENNPLKNGDVTTAAGWPEG